MAHLLARLVALNEAGPPVRGVRPPLGRALFRPIRRSRTSSTAPGSATRCTCLTDVPIGALTLALVLDFFGQHTGADIAIVVGVLSMVAAAVAEFADYADTDGLARVRAALHATIIVGLVVYAISLGLRAGALWDRPVLPVVGGRDT